MVNKCDICGDRIDKSACDTGFASVNVQEPDGPAHRTRTLLCWGCWLTCLIAMSEEQARKAEAEYFRG